MTELGKEDKWLRTGEAAAQLGVSTKTLRRLVLEEGIPHTILNVQLRLKQSDLDAYVKTRSGN